MDPNANLQEQETLLAYIGAYSPTLDGPARVQDAKARVVELRRALRTWLNGGGFAPDWDAAPRARTYFKQ